MTLKLAFAAKITLTKDQEVALADYLASIKILSGEKSFIDQLKEGHARAYSKAYSQPGALQGFDAHVTALHPRICRQGLKKINRYEQYHQHMPFIKLSEYDEKLQQIKLVIDHLLLPYSMILVFKLPRIANDGLTPFYFSHGIFTGLKGSIHVKTIGNRCLYSLEAKWLGKETNLSNTIIESFTEAVLKMGLEHLIRISSY